MSRILLLTHDHPAPGYGGGERTLSIYKALQRLGEVHVLLVSAPIFLETQPKEGMDLVRLLDSMDQATRWYWRRWRYLFYDYRSHPRVANAVEELHRKHKFDAFFGRYQTPIMGACTRFGPSFVDVDCVPTERFAQRFPFEARIRRAAMNWSHAKFKCVYVMKKSDLSKFSHPNSRVLPCISSQPQAAGVRGAGGNGLRMLFVGGLGHRPNRDGLMRFIERSLPIIRSTVPGAVLRVVGVGTETLNGLEGVLNGGFVKDLASEYVNADVSICPIWEGWGAMVKVAEAAGFGMPIVSTAHAARSYEGILEPNRDLISADSDEGLATACVELLTNTERRRMLGENAKTTASTMLSQSMVDHVIEETVGPWLR
jgi:glycosyltransferase involved in cell wall biosynthesis